MMKTFVWKPDRDEESEDSGIIIYRLSFIDWCNLVIYSFFSAFLLFAFVAMPFSVPGNEKFLIIVFPGSLILLVAYYFLTRGVIIPHTIYQMENGDLFFRSLFYERTVDPSLVDLILVSRFLSEYPWYAMTRFAMIRYRDIREGSEKPSLRRIFLFPEVPGFGKVVRIIDDSNPSMKFKNCLFV